MNIEKKRFRDLRGAPNFFLRIPKNVLDRRLHKKESKCLATRLTDGAEVKMNPTDLVIRVGLNFCHF
jgi:hypothetical protein